MRAQHEGTICMHKSYKCECTQKTNIFLLGTGRMPHLVGGAMGVTLCHDNIRGSGYTRWLHHFIKYSKDILMLHVDVDDLYFDLDC